MIPLIPDRFINPTIEYIVNSGRIESYEIELSEWINYFGIKSRVKDNCFLLGETLITHGLNKTDFLP